MNAGAAIQKGARRILASDYGARIAAERRFLRLTQAALAARARVGRETIYRVEGGRVRSPAVLFAILRALDLDYLPLPDGWRLPADPDLPCFGARVRRRRRELGLSLADVAGIVGVSAATLSRFESEKSLPAALVKTVVDRRGDLVVSITSDALAVALGLKDAYALDEFCRRQAPRRHEEHP